MTRSDTDARSRELSPDQEILHAARDVRAALLRDDADRLADRVTDDFRGFDGAGRRYGKAELRTVYVPAGASLEAFAVGEVEVDVLGESAVVTGRGTVRGASGDGTFERDLGFLDVWALRDERWQLFASHVTEIPTRT
jgi:ketosteroid isomerase-like protein